MAHRRSVVTAKPPHELGETMTSVSVSGAGECAKCRYRQPCWSNGRARFHCRRPQAVRPVRGSER